MVGSFVGADEGCAEGAPVALVGEGDGASVSLSNVTCLTATSSTITMAAFEMFKSGPADFC